MCLFVARIVTKARRGRGRRRRLKEFHIGRPRLVWKTSTPNSAARLQAARCRPRWRIWVLLIFSSSCNKSELDKFLAKEPEDDGPKFDILAWWKVNSSRFPLLACLARDVLAIPISTVASESAFSTGGRVLDDFRTSLTPFMVEALVCTQDWLRRTTPIDIAENTAELTKLEQELIAEYKDIKAKASKSNTRSTTKPTS